jgi:hypothetical protein
MEVPFKKNKSLLLFIDEDTHGKLKELSSKEKLSLAECVRKILFEYFRSAKFKNI